MNIDLTAQQLEFQAEVRDFIKTTLPDALRRKMRAGYLPSKEEIVAWQRALNQRGWAAPHWPKAYGGSELGQIERHILLEELYGAPAPVPGTNVLMLGPLLLRFGTEQQKEYWLPILANLDIWFCQGFSEPGAGSDLAALRTSAVRDGEDYIINGQKIWTTNAHIADWAFCLVRTSRNERKQEGITFVMFDLRTPGVTVRPIHSIDGGRHLNEMFFDNVRVPVVNRVGGEGQGWELARYLLAAERSGIAGVGLCRERLTYARHLLADRRRGAERYEQEISVLEAEVRALEMTNWRFMLGNTGSAGEAWASVLKLKGIGLQQEVAALLARIAGAQAIRRGSMYDPQIEGSPLPLRYLQSRAFSIYGGTSEIQKDIAARTVLEKA